RHRYAVSRRRELPSLPNLPGRARYHGRRGKMSKVDLSAASRRRYRGRRPRTGRFAQPGRRPAMGKTLNLCDSLLTMGRELHERGRPAEAAGVLNRLAGFRGLPAPVAEETHARLAAIALQRHDYRQARRHLASALI